MRHVSRTISSFILILFVFAGSGSLPKPEVFIQQLYNRYLHQDIPDFLGPTGDTLFSKRLIGILRARSKMGSEKHGIGFDPLCQCADSTFPGYVISKYDFKLVLQKDGSYMANIGIIVGGFGNDVDLKLLANGNHWVIDDIATHEYPSLYRLLQYEIKQQKANQTAPR